jgi:hypothetical protein
VEPEPAAEEVVAEAPAALELWVAWALAVAWGIGLLLAGLGAR